MSSLDATIRGDDVVVFSSSWCPYCKRAVSSLKAAGYTPKVLDVDSMPGSVRGQLRSKVGGKSSVPQVFVKGRHIGGCNDGGLGGVLPSLKNGTIQRLMAGAGAGAGKKRKHSNAAAGAAASGQGSAQPGAASADTGSPKKKKKKKKKNTNADAGAQQPPAPTPQTPALPAAQSGGGADPSQAKKKKKKKKKQQTGAVPGTDAAAANPPAAKAKAKEASEIDDIFGTAAVVSAPSACPLP